MAKEEKVKDGNQKMTSEQLLKVVNNLSTQNDYLTRQATSLVQKVKELSDFTLFKRLDYLFKVVENREKFSKEFVNSCTDEIVTIITLPPMEEKDTKDTQETEREE